MKIILKTTLYTAILVVVTVLFCDTVVSKATQADSQFRHTEQTPDPKESAYKQSKKANVKRLVYTETIFMDISLE
tara:strand:- start:176 stop:400 length:225 start_codon:yes stop_codon:yes gene_type:complete